MKRIPLGQRRWLLKHATGHCAVGRMMERRNHQDHSRCPRCNADNETTLHIILCPATTANEQWLSCIFKLLRWMSSHHTHPLLQSQLIDFIHTWYRTGLTPRYHASSDPIQQALGQQASIGMFNLFLGRVANQITELQHVFLLTQETQMTGDSWTAGLIVQLWDISRKMWDHRNSIKHSNENPDLLKTIADLVEEVEAQLALGSNTLLPNDRHLVQHPLRKFQGKTKAHLHQWLHSVTLGRQAYFDHQHQQAQQLQQQQQLMQQWITTPAASDAAIQTEHLQLPTVNEDVDATSDTSICSQANLDQAVGVSGTKPSHPASDSSSTHDDSDDDISVLSFSG